MPNTFRFYTIRATEELTREEQDKVSILTHPVNSQSRWFRALENFCKTHDFKGLVNAILEHLKSKESIHSINQLDSDFQPVYEFVERRGSIKTEQDKEELFELVDLRRFSDFFKESHDQCDNDSSKKFSRYHSDSQRVADTMLSLSVLGKLGHKENMNYTLLFQVLKLLKLLYEKKKEVLLAEIIQLFDKTVALPPCFFELNPCSKKLKPVKLNKPFSHLGLLDFSEKNHEIQHLKYRDKDLVLAEKEGTVERAHPYRPTIPSTNECECFLDETCKDQNPCCATIKPFVTDLMVVREDLHCYKAADLAYVETIMLGEERTRSHRNLERTEDYSETETSIINTEEKDHLVSERSTVQIEAQKTIESDLSVDAGVTANAWGTGYSVNTSLDVSSQNSKLESQRLAREQAVDITERTVRKIQEKSREFNSQKRVVETEETNTHIFKNNTSDSEKHINGMYQYVEAEYNGQVMNYRKALVVQIVLPDPLALYEHLLGKEIAPFHLEKPVKPDLDPKDINFSNYISLAKLHNAEATPPPVSEVSFVKTYHKAAHVGNEEWTVNNYELAVSSPNEYDYVPYKAIVSSHFSSGGGKYHNVCIGNTHFSIGASVNALEKQLNYQGTTEVIPIITKSRGDDFSVSIEVYCKLSDQSLENWQIQAYSKIMQKYEEELKHYEAELARYNIEKEEKTKFGNSIFENRMTEKEQLKHQAISYLSCQFFERFNAMKRNVKPCGYPQMDFEQAEEDGKYIQFFEQLFNWNLMTYLFYGFSWSDPADWANKLQKQSNDLLHKKALSSGAVKLEIPIRAGSEQLFMHWITYGEIWQGSGEPPVPGSPYYISMAQELKEQKGNFNVDREGYLSVLNGSDTIHLSNSSYFWDFTSGAIDQLKVTNDIDREIIIDCIPYRIVSITQLGSSTDQWTIQIERPYEADDQANLKWSTGAIYVGAKFRYKVPTPLVYLRNKKVNGTYVTEDCLPCFPQPECE